MMSIVFPSFVLVVLLHIFATPTVIVNNDLASEVFGTAIVGECGELAGKAQQMEQKFAQVPSQIGQIREKMSAKYEGLRRMDLEREMNDWEELKAKIAKGEKEYQALVEEEKKWLAPVDKYYFAKEITNFCDEFLRGEFGQLRRSRYRVGAYAKRLARKEGDSANVAENGEEKAQKEEGEAQNLLRAFNKVAAEIAQKVQKLTSVVAAMGKF